MEKETMSSYGFILITVLLAFFLIIIATPIALKMSDHTDKQAEQMVENLGILGEKGDPNSYCTIIVRFYETKTRAEAFYTSKTVIRKGEQYVIIPPELNGYMPGTIKEGANVLPTFKISTKTVEEEIADNKFNNMRIIDVFYEPEEYNIDFNVVQQAEINIVGVTPTSYQKGSIIALPIAIKENHIFLGWCDNPDLSGRVYKTIETHDFGNKVFYPKFISET